jgi:cytochrome c-type biogenesis protein CcmH
MVGFLIWVFPVLVFVLFAIRQRGNRDHELDSGEQAVEIHKERLVALSEQFEKGDMTEEEYQSFKLEEEKALLADSVAAKKIETHSLQLPWAWVPALIVVIMGAGWYTYSQVGALDAVTVREQFKELASATDFDSQQVEEAVSGYEALLLTEPENIEGWFRLARMQMDMELFDSAVSSLEHVLKQLRGIEHNAEDEATILAYIGQSRVALGQNEEALAAFEESLEYFQSSNALGMAGRMAFETGDYQKAIDYWTRLKLNNPDGNLEIVDDFINQAIEQLTAQGIDYEVDQPTRVIVTVELPAAYEGLADDAALFVYARPVGQRMPLAVKRLNVTGQRMVVILSDADAMGPMGGISTQETIEVTARISLTGIANTQPGDWNGNTEVIELTQKESAVQINISQP